MLPFILFFFVLTVWLVDISSLTRDQTHALDSESKES